MLWPFTRSSTPSRTTPPKASPDASRLETAEALEALFSGARGETGGLGTGSQATGGLGTGSQATKLSTYDAAAKDRRSKNWKTRTGTADQAVLPDRVTLAARARAETRDNWAARSIREAYVRNVVGKGITPAPKARDLDGELLDGLNQQAKRMFGRWARRDNCDLERRKSFWQMQQLAVRQLVEVGEVFFVFHFRPAVGGAGLRLQVLEVEDLDTTQVRNSENDNEIRAGVEVDVDGAPVAYWFREDEQGLLRDKRIRVPAERVLHVFDQERPRQTHGVTYLHAILQRIRANDQYDRNEQLAKWVESCIGLLVTRDYVPDVGLPGDEEYDLEAGEPDDGAYAGTGTSSTHADDEFRPMMVWEGNEGEKVEPFNPQRPGAMYDPYMKRQLHMIAAGANVSFAQLAREYSGTFGSQRQSMLDDNKVWDVTEALLTEQLNDAVYAVWYRLAALEGLLTLDLGEYLADPDRFHECEWSGPAREWIDPLKQAQAEVLAIQNGLDSPQRLANLRNMDAKDVLRDIAELKGFAEELGLELPIFAADEADEVAGKDSIEDEEDPDWAGDGAPSVTGDGRPTISRKGAA